MTVVTLQFPAGRFHATPWGRHVNEGAVEWPPSPWRLLRALVATWHLKPPADLPEPLLRRLLDRLADAAPAYSLPGASLGHTRHYLPFNEGKNEKTTKVFDTFIHVPKEAAVFIHWPVDLAPDARAALDALLPRLGYFGRAESLVEATLLAPDAAAPEPDAAPLPENTPLPAGGEIVRLLAPLSPGDYGRWREGYLAAASQFALVTGDEGKKKVKSRAGKPKPSDLPPDLFTALHADTGDLQAAGWPLPPGARMLTYARPERGFDIAPVPRRLSVSAKTPPTVARYTIATAVSPSITAAVSVGDRVHRALVSRSPQPVFTGCDAAGVPLRHQHRHASILSECDLPDDRIRFLTIHAPDGLDAPARHALSALRSVWGHGGHDLQLVLLGFGEPADFAGPDAEAGESRILGEATEWVSLTPFVPTRHGKTRHNGEPKRDAHGDQIGGPRHDLRRLLRLLHPGNELDILREEARSGTRRPLRWLQFQRRRANGEGARAGDFGFGFRVRFARPVRGPLAVGYGAHFGLGLFVPAIES